MKNNKIIKLIGFFLIVTIFINLSLIPVSYGNGSYEAPINIESEIIYEYTYVDHTYINDLVSEDISKYFFLAGGLYGVELGDQIKYSITDINEDTEFWDFSIEYYIGLNLDKKIQSTMKYIYKTPAEFLIEFFNSSDPNSRPNWEKEPLIIPSQSNIYLTELNQTIPLSYQQITKVNTTHITFDFALLGNYSDKIIYSYNSDGICEDCKIFYNNNLVFQLELEVFKLGLNYTFIIFLIIILFTTGLIALEIYLIIKRRKLKKSRKD